MTDYNPFAKTFSQSRMHMKWEEIDYFIPFLSDKKNIKILDIGCGNGRLLGEFLKSSIDMGEYTGIDISSELLDEAKKSYPTHIFLEKGMIDLNTLSGKKYDDIFFIASFHHLQTFEERGEVLKQAYNLLNTGGIIYMTNWALSSSLNAKKYESSRRKDSKNEFGSYDYDVKIGEYKRFYHDFSLVELEYLFQKTGFKILENRLFENQKNYVSILSKPHPDPLLRGEGV